MTSDDLIFGLLDTSPSMGDPRVAAKFRDFTLSWSRYDYHGPIVEAASVDEILRAALHRGARYCFIQSYGNVICENWTLDNWQSRDFCSALAAWTKGREFLIAGSIVGDAGRWYGFDRRCLLVDLETYARLGCPSFEAPCERPVPLPKPAPSRAGDRITALRPTDEVESATPAMPGWRCMAESLKAGLDVSELGEEVRGRTLWLEADHPSQRTAMSRYLGRGIERFGEDGERDALTDDQRRFLGIVARQARHARRGVFLFNIESYADVETPPEAFRPPVSTLYSVASGFKPNRILQTHGFDESTRVVYFDYSPNALRIKKCMVDEWDGEDFPDFVRQLFRMFPYPETFYHLWGDLSPDEVDRSDLDNVWRREVDRWGGPDALAAHWRAYRRLPHQYVCCDILADPSPLMDTVAPEASAILWWSNAFFTMYGNWFHDLAHREARYAHWIDQLASKNPELYLYGSDFNNTNVNFIQAGDYRDDFRRHRVRCLEPYRSTQRTVRM